MNTYRVIANEPIEFKGVQYQIGAVIEMHAYDSGIFLVTQKVRLETEQAPGSAEPPKRKRGRPRKNPYQTADLTAKE